MSQSSHLQVELVAPDRRIWSGAAKMVIAKTVEGDIGVMPGHSPVLGVLVSHPVIVRTVEGPDVVAAVYGGFLSVTNDVVTVLAEECELANEIDEAEVRAQLEGAEGDDRQRAETRLRAVQTR